MKITFFLMVFNSDWVLEECLRSVMPYGDVVAVEGPVKYWQNKGYSTSTDSTNVILDELGIKTIHGQWNEKDDMARAGSSLVATDTDFIWQLDADEIWKDGDIVRIKAMLERGNVDSMSFRMWSFYGGFERIMGGFEENFEVHRIQRWQPTRMWAVHRPPTVLDQNGKPWREGRHMNHMATDAFGLRFYHYSYVFPKQMAAKAEYYQAYTGGGCIPDYMHNVYLPWVTGDAQARARVEDMYNGVHDQLPARRGECRTRRFDGEHPKWIAERMDTLKARFDKELGEIL